MKHLFFQLLLLSYSILTFSQSNTRLISDGNPRTSNGSKPWDIDKFVYSHSNTNHIEGKRLLDFDAIDNWVGLVDNRSDLAISPNGNFITYGYGNFLGRRFDTLVVQSINSLWKKSFARVSPGYFSDDSKLYVFLDKKKMNFVF